MFTTVRRLVPLTLALVVYAPNLAAQKITPYFGGGMLSPAGDFADYAKSGWLVFGGFNRPLAANPRIVLGLTASYGSAKHEGNQNEATNIPGVSFDVGYGLGSATSKVSPYVRASIGALQHRYDPGDTGGASDSETKLSIGAGAGLSMAMGTNSLFGGVHYINAEDTSFLIVYVGFGLGNRAAASFQPVRVK